MNAFPVEEAHALPCQGAGIRTKEKAGTMFSGARFSFRRGPLPSEFSLLP